VWRAGYGASCPACRPSIRKFQQTKESARNIAFHFSSQQSRVFQLTAPLSPPTPMVGDIGTTPLLERKTTSPQCSPKTREISRIAPLVSKAKLLLQWVDALREVVGDPICLYFLREKLPFATSNWTRNLLTCDIGIHPLSCLFVFFRSVCEEGRRETIDLTPSNGL